MQIYVVTLQGKRRDGNDGIAHAYSFNADHTISLQEVIEGYRNEYGPFRQFTADISIMEAE